MGSVNKLVPGWGMSRPDTRLLTEPILSLDDNRRFHEWVNLAMVGEGASFGEGKAERAAIGCDRGVNTRVECGTIIAGDGMGRACGIGPGDGRAYLDGDGGRAECEGAGGCNRNSHSGT